jgi:hypothetical protein
MFWVSAWHIYSTFHMSGEVFYSRDIGQQLTQSQKYNFIDIDVYLMRDKAQIQ